MRESHESCSSAEMVGGIEEVSVVRIVERGMEKRVSSSAMGAVATVGDCQFVSLNWRVVAFFHTNASSSTLIPHIDQIDLV